MGCALRGEDGRRWVCKGFEMSVQQRQKRGMPKRGGDTLNGLGGSRIAGLRICMCQVAFNNSCP